MKNSILSKNLQSDLLIYGQTWEHERKPGRTWFSRVPKPQPLTCPSSHRRRPAGSGTGFEDQSPMITDPGLGSEYQR